MRLERGALVPTLLGLILVAVAAFIQITGTDAIRITRERLESFAYDLRMRMLLPEAPGEDPRIVILDIDEKSLREQGHWPWPRWKLAELVARVTDSGAAVIGFDVVFAETGTNPALETAGLLGRRATPDSESLVSTLRGLAPLVDPDEEFAVALASANAVLGYTFSTDDGIAVGALPPPAVAPDDQDQAATMLLERKGYVGNIPALQAAAAGGGFFSLQADEDGIIRRAPLLMLHDHGVYTSFALEVARQYLDRPPVQLQAVRTGAGESLSGISLGGMISIPTDMHGQVLVPYRGPSGGYPRVPATDVLEGRGDPSVFRDAIVLVGTSAAGLVDLRAVPVQGVFPGVEVHANLITGILDGSFPSEPGWTAEANLGGLVLLGLVLASTLPHLPAAGMLLATALAFALALGTYLWSWTTHGVNLAITLPVLLILGLAAMNLSWGFVSERMARRDLEKKFGQYVPPAVVEQIRDKPEHERSFAGESREITVMFSDIRGFTSLSERMNANELKRMLNFYLTEMTQVVFETGGTIDKYVGDMIMAFWGAPLPDADQREHALLASLNMLERLEGLRDRLQASGWPQLQVGIGLNTGNMNVGDMGSEFRRCYTVIGDAVNLGSRLEGLSKFYGVRVVASESTRAGQDQFLFRKLDLVRVKGKDKAVAIYEPVCRMSRATPELLAEIREYHDALAAYFARDWQGATTAFANLAAKSPGTRLYSLYEKRAGELLCSPAPADWDGVFTHTSKWD